MNAHLSTPMRRRFLQLLAGGVGAAAFGSVIPQIGRAAGARDPRFIVIILRGAMDGMGAVPPVGDPDFAGLGARFKDGTQPMPIGGMFGLHPSLANLARQYKAGQALIVHASATPYRDRSHFDGQDVLESGQAAPGQTASGWLNRALQVLPGEQKVDPRKGLAVGTSTPLVIRGPANVLGWAPTTLGKGDPDLNDRILALYQYTDQTLATVFKDALMSNQIASGASGAGASGTPADPKMMAVMADGLAHLMIHPDGPRVAALAFEGWDTHTTEPGRLATQLAGLDGALATLETTLGPVWNDTAVLVVTEFGRTALVNGTQGTDHGTATAAFITGGAVKGGRVIADWPGLKTSQLYQARDLAPTTDIRAAAKGILAGLYDIPEGVLAEKVFPGSGDIKPMQDIIA